MRPMSVMPSFDSFCQNVDKGGLLNYYSFVSGSFRSNLVIVQTYENISAVYITCAFF